MSILGQSSTEWITVAITQEMAHLVRDVVRSGQDGAANELVRGAVRLGKEHQTACALQVEELWQGELESEPVEEGTLVLARLRTRHDETHGLPEHA